MLKNKLQQILILTRINHPVGIWLLFLPCLFGIALAVKEVPQIKIAEILRLAFLFLLGSIIMRSAGCVINDLWDQNFDKKVNRTKKRPLAAKTVSAQEAIILTSILLALGLTILLQFNFKVILSGILALILVISYPLMKRITYYPQIFLGLTFNFGILMANLQIIGMITINSLLLYGAAIIWTVIYDTIYGYQDIKDDLQIGVKSTSIKFKKNPQIILKTLNVTMFSLFLLLGWRAKFDSNFFLAILLLDLFLNKQINDCDFNNPQSCLKVFKANIGAGFLILTAIILG